MRLPRGLRPEISAHAAHGLCGSGTRRRGTIANLVRSEVSQREELRSTRVLTTAIWKDRPRRWWARRAYRNQSRENSSIMVGVTGTVFVLIVFISLATRSSDRCSNCADKFADVFCM